LKKRKGFSKKGQGRKPQKGPTHAKKRKTGETKKKEEHRSKKNKQSQAVIADTMNQRGSSNEKVHTFKCSEWMKIKNAEREQRVQREL